MKTTIYRERNVENLTETLQPYSLRNAKLGFIKMFLVFSFRHLILKIIIKMIENYNFLITIIREIFLRT